MGGAAKELGCDQQRLINQSISLRQKCDRFKQLQPSVHWVYRRGHLATACSTPAEYMFGWHLQQGFTSSPELERVGSKDPES